MKDMKATNPMQAKRERAIGLLKNLGLWRGCTECHHKYRNSRGQITHPGMKFMDDPWRM